MEEYLTAKQVQELIQVDRITVYRMLHDGRLKGIKIGQQWRFNRRDVASLLEGPATPAQPAAGNTHPVFPVHCVQTIQDLFAEVSQLGALVLDRSGETVTRPSQVNAFQQLLLENPSSLASCQEAWRKMVHESTSGMKFFTGCAGMQYCAAPIMDRGEQVGLFLVGPFNWETPDPRAEAERLRRLAHTHNLDLAALQAAAGSVPIIPAAEHSRVEAFPFTAARAIQSILHERTGFVDRLQQIANLTQVS